MFLISTTNLTLCATGTFARVWNSWELNPKPINCKFDALPLCHREISKVYLCLIRLVDLQWYQLEFWTLVVVFTDLSNSNLFTLFIQSIMNINSDSDTSEEGEIKPYNVRARGHDPQMMTSVWLQTWFPAISCWKSNTDFSSNILLWWHACRDMTVCCSK